MMGRMEIRTPRGSLSAPNWKMIPYSGGSDHMQFIDRKIPSTMLGHSPDYTHHTSDDTPDRVDPVELERAELVAAAALLYLADLSEAEALELADLVGGNALGRIGATVRGSQRLAAERSGVTEPFDTANRAYRRLLGEEAALASVLTFHDSPAVRARVQAWSARAHWLASRILDDMGSELERVAAGEPGVATDARVPARLTRGPLDFGLPASALDEDRAEWYRSPDFPLSGNARFELVNFIDGARTVTEIRNELRAEYGPLATGAVARYLEDLVAVGAVEWTSPGGGR